MCNARGSSRALTRLMLADPSMAAAAQDQTRRGTGHRTDGPGRCLDLDIIEHRTSDSVGRWPHGGSSIADAAGPHADRCSSLPRANTRSFESHDARSPRRSLKTLMSPPVRIAPPRPVVAQLGEQVRFRPINANVISMNVRSPKCEAAPCKRTNKVEDGRCNRMHSARPVRDSRAVPTTCETIRAI